MVRCKFRCISKTESEGGIWSDKGGFGWGIVYGYKFQASDSGAENRALFASFIPDGLLEARAVRNDLFAPGGEYYLDFSEAPSE